MSSQIPGGIGGTGGTAAIEAGGSGGSAEPLAPLDAAVEIDARVVMHDAAQDAGPDVVERDGGEDAFVDAGEPLAEYSTRISGTEVPKIHINKIVRERGYCVQLVIARSSSPPTMMSELEAPTYWRYHIAIGIETDGDCREATPDGAPRIAQQASSVRGRVSWDEPRPNEFRPCSIDVDAELTFLGSDLIPTHDHMLVTDLPVECEP